MLPPLTGTTFRNTFWAFTVPVRSFRIFSEISTIAAWVRGGAPEGDPRDLPRPPRWTDGWQLGTPDLVVRPPAYTLPAEGTDVFRIFVLPLPVSVRVTVRFS